MFHNGKWQLTCHRLSELREPATSTKIMKDTYNRSKSPHGNAGSWKGCRFQVFRCGSGWALQDTKPDDPAYQFRKNGRVLYAAKILAETYNVEYVKVLIKEAKRLELTIRKVSDD